MWITIFWALHFYFWHKLIHELLNWLQGYNTAWKVSTFGVFLSVFSRIRTEVSLCIQSRYGEIQTRKTPNTDTFHAVIRFCRIKVFHENVKNGRNCYMLFLLFLKMLKMEAKRQESAPLWMFSQREKRYTDFSPYQIFCSNFKILAKQLVRHGTTCHNTRNKIILGGQFSEISIFFFFINTSGEWFL